METRKTNKKGLDMNIYEGISQITLTKKNSPTIYSVVCGMFGVADNLRFRLRPAFGCGNIEYEVEQCLGYIVDHGGIEACIQALSKPCESGPFDADKDEFAGWVADFLGDCYKQCPKCKEYRPFDENDTNELCDKCIAEL